MPRNPDQPAPSGARHSRATRRIQAAPRTQENHQIGSRWLKITLAATSAVVLGIGGMGYVAVGNLNGDLSQIGGMDLGSKHDGATDILLVGMDSRTDAKGNPLTEDEIRMLRAGNEEATNTDTMILIRIPNDGSSATAVSIPRDTYVATDTMGNMKLNGVYGEAKQQKINAMLEQDPSAAENSTNVESASTQAGRDALVSSIADLTGITVDHYAEVGLLGFVLLTDAVGGVDVCLNNDVNEPMSGAHFTAGRQTLDGPDALSFVRQRHDLPRGDLDRIVRQQAYMASLTNKILSTSTLTSPSALNNLNTAVQRSLVIDEGWDVMDLATQLQNLTGGNVSFQTIPVTSINGVGDYGESIVTVDVQQVHAFFKELLGEDDTDSKDDGDSGTPHDDGGEIPTFNAGDYHVNVLNASQIQGLAARVADLATNYGYGIGEVGNATESGVSQSQVNAKNPSDPAARALARQLGGLPIVTDSSLGDKELSITLAGTYSGPGTLENSAPLEDPNSSNVGTLTEGMKDLDGDGIPDENSTTTQIQTMAVVGTVGDASEDQNEVSQPINAGGDGPMCVN